MAHHWHASQVPGTRPRPSQGCRASRRDRAACEAVQVVDEVGILPLRNDWRQSFAVHNPLCLQVRTMTRGAS